MGCVISSIDKTPGRVHLVYGHIKARNNLLRIADQLAVQVLIKGLEMGTVEIQIGLLQCVNLLQLLKIQWLVNINILGDFVLLGAGVNKAHNKRLELGFALADNNIGSPDDELRCLRRFRYRIGGFRALLRNWFEL